MADTPAARRRVLACAALGAVAGVAAGLLLGPLSGVGAGWIVASGAYLVSIWWRLHRFDADATLDHAGAEDPSRRITHVAVLAVSVASLAAVVLVLGTAGAEAGALAAGHSVLGLVMVALSWLVLHTLYTLRYAHLYARSGERVPVDFNQDAPPDYLDFAYFAFTLGMTYQVSDTNIGDRRIRRAALAHALISFVFGVVILAATINLLAGIMSHGW